MHTLKYDLEYFRDDLVLVINRTLLGSLLILTFPLPTNPLRDKGLNINHVKFLLIKYNCIINKP
jgi:hypothetical protein